ncbi:type II secretion system protein [Thermus igniterrae]|uniref:type II secretion system protein n=1 Tax=Thermus igniterrae TaxID=88189 RepID=UPI00035ECFB2|nr:prepilin-type N-terminal cleavage/methylation domain-containing protein [Thermus igniterrae]
MRQGFTLVEVALALVLVGAAAYVVLSLSQTLQAGSNIEPREEVLQAAETLLEAGFSPPACPSTASVQLGDRTYRVCQQPARLSLTPPSNMTASAVTYRFEDATASPGEVFFLTRVAWEGSPPPPPPSPNFSATCQKVSATRLRMAVNNTGTSVTTNRIALLWNGEGNKKVTAVYSGTTQLWSNNRGVKKGTQISLSQSLVFGSQTLEFVFNRALRSGNYTFTLQLFVGQGNNPTTYTVSCSVGW